MSKTWDAYVIFVNCYSAIEETHDAIRRMWERPDSGLTRFCRDANPFVWDGRSSFEESIFEDFSRDFQDRFEHGECTGKEGYAFCHDWLRKVEETLDYGHALVGALDQTASETDFVAACDAVSRQVQGRAAHIERTPQDLPGETSYEVEKKPTPSDIDAVIELIAKGDKEFAQSLRARLADGD